GRTARGGLELGARVELDGILYRRDHIVVEEGSGIGGLDQRGHVEGAVAEAVVDPVTVAVAIGGAEAAVEGEVLQIPGRVRDGLDAGVEVAVGPAEGGVGAGVVVAEEAFAAGYGS